MKGPAQSAWIGSPTAAYSAALLALAACVVAYLPGLKGPFLFDDFGSLAELGDLGGVRDWMTFKAFVFGGDAGPTGRPLALLSFLVDGSNWPTDPWPFKRTNLVIHLVTGAILCRLSYRILLASALESKAALRLAVFAAAAWLLHPFLVSTTLYAVQRMAQLSTLFVLAGLLSYVYGRSQLSQNSVRAHISMTLGLVAFGVLAVLSKENGALLPVLVAVLEFTVFARHRRAGDKPNGIWMAAIVILPSAAICLYLASFALGGRWLNANPVRGISVYERILTEGRVLFDYLYHWFLPHPYTSGVFQDHFVPSKGPLSPPTTALAALGHVALIAGAFVYRRRLPIAAFAVLFFYSSHLMESTFINLELYFEHRSYLANAFLLLPLLVMLEARLSKRALTLSASLALILLAILTHTSATVWSTYEDMVRTAARIAPTSARAQQQYSQLLFNAGDYAAANDVASAAIERLPDAESLHIHKAIISCRQAVDSSDDLQGLANAVNGKPFDVRLFDYYQTLLLLTAEGGCNALQLSDLRRTLVDMQLTPLNDNPRFVGYHQLKFLIGLAEIHLGDPKAAGELFRQSLASRPTAGRAMLMAAVMATNENYYDAKVFSDVALAMLRSGAEAGSAREADIIDFKRNLHEEIVANARH